MENVKSREGLSKRINEALKIKPAMVRVEDNGDGRYGIFFGSEVHEIVFLEESTGIGDVLKYVESRITPDCTSRGITSAASNKRYLTIKPRRV